jgi:uncharacterized protein YjbJ (UPF0337 family)
MRSAGLCCQLASPIQRRPIAGLTDPNFDKEKEQDMNKDRIVGAAKQAKGTVEEAAGKLLGDAKLVADGKADKIEGKIQNAAGSVTDEVSK